MAYPPHYLLSFGGTAGELTETWVCGIRLIAEDTGVFGEVDQQEYLEDVAAPALTAWMLRPTSLVATVALLKWAKFNLIDSQGHYDDPGTTHEHSFGAGSPGGANNTLHPLQVALVLTWRTNVAERGLASRGRIYSPRPSIAVGASGDIDGAARVGAATSAATLLNTLDITVGAGWMRPAIVSPGRGWPEQDNPGSANQIDYVTVDSSLDVQRRRSFSQTKEISSAPVTY